jgi:hypothetical protein
LQPTCTTPHPSLNIISPPSWQATGDATYKTEAVNFMNKHVTEEGLPWNNFDWDSASWGATLLLAKDYKNAAAISRIQVRCVTDHHGFALSIARDLRDCRTVQCESTYLHHWYLECSLVRLGALTMEQTVWYTSDHGHTCG